MDHKTKEIVPGQVYLSEFADGFRVASVTAPYFCVARKTREEAITAANVLLRDYFKWTTGKSVKLTQESEPYIAPQLPILHFSPQEVVKMKVAA